MIRKIVLAIAGVFWLQLLALAQTNPLNLEDIYKNNLYAAKGFGPIRFMKDNHGYTTLEYNTALKSNEIVLYNIKQSSASVLVSAQQLIPQGNTTPLSIHDYSWSNDNTKLLVYTNSKKVWRQNTKGDYWVLNLTTGNLHQVGASLASASLMFAKFSPNGKEIAYVSDLNIYKEMKAIGSVNILIMIFLNKFRLIHVISCYCY